ncbi:Zinc/iron permease [Lipomyces kononenkoae]|uniref:Zinc/iron permease n=1 Tax=Lipomyces kononenkoae TaxID=34357 RepID=A0ACC3TDC5_LIPKO
MASSFDPTAVNLETADPAQVICFLQASADDYNGQLGARISAVFVIFVVSTGATYFPVASRRFRMLKMPEYVYLFARYFGAGVIVSTAFVHLVDPAYQEIGPQSCVGMTGGWASYSWPPAIILSSVVGIFLLDFWASRYVEQKYGRSHAEMDTEILLTEGGGRMEGLEQQAHIHMHGDDDDVCVASDSSANRKSLANIKSNQEETTVTDVEAVKDDINSYLFKEQMAAFLILEFGIIFHSIFIGLNLGVAGASFSTLYPVLVFHQAFEGLGIGARMSAIPFPTKYRYGPELLSLAYGITTPISIAVGIGARGSYSSSSFTTNIVSGIFDSISAGILIYSGLVELVARDFLFDPHRTKSSKKLTFMVISLLTGAGIMSLIGKWA